MTKRMIIVMMAVVSCAAMAASADVFDPGGANEFTIEFVTISANPGVTRSTNTSGDSVETFTAGAGVGDYTDPGNDYRMGTYEITNDQWGKFVNIAGAPTGTPLDAYDESPYFTGADVPTSEVSWYEAAQFVNWLNTSTGHQAAYKFYEATPGDPATLTLDVWTAAEAAGDTNLYRHREAFYFLPTEDEWVKAGYWNGTALQTYATKPGDTLHQGDGTSGTGWNYYDGGYATDPFGPWDVGSGSEELNGTSDMMGNVWEWMESPSNADDYGTGSFRCLRGDSSNIDESMLASSGRVSLYYPYNEGVVVGFRVASVPEPCSLGLLSLGGLALIKRRRK